MSFLGWLPPEAVKIALVLFLSFLVGLEREEHKSGEAPSAFGGVRTYPLIGLIGYALALLSDGELLPQALGFLAIAGFLMLAYREKLAAGRAGVTSEMAGLLIYLVGALVERDYYWIAVTLGVASVLLLELKAALEGLTRRIAPDDILAFGKFLLLTAVVLPLLPNAELTRFRVNPFKTWVIVAAVSGISYAGYVLQRLMRERAGTLLTAALGGTYSSTATTVALARQAAAAGRPRLYAGATLLASGVMYLRLSLLLLLFNEALFVRLAAPFVLLAAAAIVGGLLWSSSGAGRGTPTPAAAPRNPLELGTALLFAGVYVVMLVATRYAADLGRAGVYGLAALMGVADVDPFTMGLTQSTPGETPLGVAAAAIVIAAASNNLIKGIYALAIARGAAGWQSVLLLAALALLGLAPLLR